ncbi:MAG: asparagine synthase C-terminal domain-containing protein [Gallionella sp.]|nr:asparagine synthase C-terminal domain-containing protein [Gallionella sp.]MDD4945569.1 asparagine synthase C-terminal domain-containing protein [Gallionella sp.]MDD5611580.1 asparagine synthase C-terminal domain-containing protein [Gallionella sp.]
MNKLWGWTSQVNPNTQDDAGLIVAMGQTAHLQTDRITSSILTHGALATDHAASLAEQSGISVVLVGQPRLTDASSTDSPAQQFLTLWQQQGRQALQKLRGPFALAVIDSNSQTALLAIDRIGIHTLAFSVTKNGLVFASRADTVAAHPDVGAQLAPQSLFNYLYFYDVPSPGSIFQNVEKLLPGECLWFENGKVGREFYWHLKYRDQPRDDFAAMSERFHEILRKSVARNATDPATAAFLSGGTDSSTVAGVLRELRDEAARTYSIGFSAEGFDEMSYARIAAKHFDLDMREYYLKPQDILDVLPLIAQHYDEPFANESAVPAYYCAKMAKADGYRVMLAGDGGDEIFGGNERYAKQRIFESYHLLPAVLRHGLIEPFASLPGLDHFPPTRKLQSYLNQANMPLPNRLESYNYTYRQPLEQMFTADFLASIDPGQPAALLKDSYDRADSGSYLNRMMHLDLKFTLADNDLRKVNGMAELAGMDVRYPLIDDEMVDFSGEVPPDWKVKGLYLRWFFKQALKDFLPDEIINKSKHGFGLPFGIWARDYAPLRARVDDRLSDFKKRGWVQPAYIDHIRNEHMTGHATYFGKMLWVIVMLEEWLEQRGM